MSIDLNAELFISADLVHICWPLKQADFHKLDCKSNQHNLHYCTVTIV